MKDLDAHGRSLLAEGEGAPAASGAARRPAMMKIGDLAKRTGCAVETIRYYERVGLLAKPARSGGNYRLYNDAHRQRLILIRNCRAFGMTHAEIRALLRLKDQGGDDCGDIDALLDAHINHIAARLVELRALQRQLQALRKSCGARRTVNECGILRELTEPQAHSGPCLPLKRACE